MTLHNLSHFLLYALAICLAVLKVPAFILYTSLSSPRPPPRPWFPLPSEDHLPYAIRQQHSIKLPKVGEAVTLITCYNSWIVLGNNVASPYKLMSEIRVRTCLPLLQTEVLLGHDKQWQDLWLPKEQCRSPDCCWKGHWYARHSSCKHHDPEARLLIA